MPNLPRGGRPEARVRVIVVNYNSGSWLKRCLASLQRQTLSDFEVVVVDNGSTDGSLCLPEGDPRFLALPEYRNLGYAAGNNLGARGARTRWLALLNPDAEAAPDWLAQLLAETEAHPECVVFGSTQLRADQPAILDGSGDCLSAYGLAWRSGYGLRRPAVLAGSEVFAACGAALAIRRDWYERLGGFEERFFCYVEDVDLCFRARLLGARVWQSSRAVVHHAGGVSGNGPFAIYHGYRNLAWMLMRCMPQPLLALALWGYLTVVLLMLLKPRPRAEWNAFRLGARDGLRGWSAMRSARLSIQRTRAVSVWRVAGWLSWSPFAPMERQRVSLSPPDLRG